MFFAWRFVTHSLSACSKNDVAIRVHTGARNVRRCYEFDFRCVCVRMSICVRCALVYCITLFYYASHFNAVNKQIHVNNSKNFWRTNFFLFMLNVAAVTTTMTVTVMTVIRRRSKWWWRAVFCMGHLNAWRGKSTNEKIDWHFRTQNVAVNEMEYIERHGTDKKTCGKEIYSICHCLFLG